MTPNRLGVGKENRLIGLVLALISFLIRRRNPSMKEALRFGCQSYLSSPPREREFS